MSSLVTVKNRSDQSGFPQSCPGACHHSSQAKREGINPNVLNVPQAHVIIGLQNKTEAVNLNFPSLYQAYVMIRLQKTEAVNLNFPSFSKAHVIIRLRKKKKL